MRGLFYLEYRSMGVRHVHFLHASCGRLTGYHVRKLEYLKDAKGGYSVPKSAACYYT